MSGTEWVIAISGLVAFVIATVAIVVIDRRLEHEAQRDAAAGLAMVLMSLNLVQLGAVVMVLLAVLGD